jgi:hypothetical protein
VNICVLTLDFSVIYIGFIAYWSVQYKHAFILRQRPLPVDKVAQVVEQFAVVFQHQVVPTKTGVLEKNTSTSVKIN